ncbi:elongation factor P hydroxylase [Marinicellulosiphila megalodicopiae]|uniref:elongation factor P hydroxylase n=1 Tax=Marinicellulosiphila megalodicopiae TaxID=2724896 RepID=UPI003BAE74FB
MRKYLNTVNATDDETCRLLTDALSQILPEVLIEGGADEPFYKAAKNNDKAKIIYRSNYPRSLLHELSHYCLAGNRRRNIDDFGYWYSPCGRSFEEQQRFELVEARPQGLEKVMCELVGLKFSPSLDDFSGMPNSQMFLKKLEESYQEMTSNPPSTASKVLEGLKLFKQTAWTKN